MWRLRTPALERALNDAQTTVTHCRGLCHADIAKLRTLYGAYHKQGGYVSSTDLSPLDSKKDVIATQYAKTSGKENPRMGQTIGQDKPLVYIRKELMDGVDRCPMCSILPVSDLDHVWPISVYGQLAVCRLNLVPVCGKCNKEKKVFTPSHFIHTYYQQFPAGVIFLVATCRVIMGKIIPRFTINQAALNDDGLAHRLNLQMKHIKLRARLQKASQEFFMKLFRGAAINSNKELKSYLEDRLMKYENGEYPYDYGRNDWRTALLRGLLACSSVDINVVKGYQKAKKRSKSVNV
jgi:hypothetical protein